MRQRVRAGAEKCEEQCVHEGAVARSQSLLKNDETYVRLAEIFGALADSSRAKIIHLLVHEELCTCDIAAALGMSDSSVSQHLRILRALRLIRSRRAGKFVYYNLDDAHVTMLVQIGLAHQGHEDELAAPVGGAVGLQAAVS